MACCSSCAVGRLCDGPALGALERFEGSCVTKWRSDVENDKRRIAGLVLATDSAIQTCRGLTAGERAAWTAWKAGWDAFNAAPVSAVFWSNECAMAAQFERDVMGWQTQIRDRCEVPGPDPNRTQSDSGTIVKWVVVGVVAVAGALALRTVLR